MWGEVRDFLLLSTTVNSEELIQHRSVQIVTSLCIVHNRELLLKISGGGDSIVHIPPIIYSRHSPLSIFVYSRELRTVNIVYIENLLFIIVYSENSRTGQPEQNSQDRRVGTEQPGQDSYF